MKKIKPVALVILDGFGYNPHDEHNAIAQAKKPFLDFALKTFPHTLLDASGPAVGLPPGYAGNSEVGHLTLGAGKRVPSAFSQLCQAIENKSFFKNPELVTHLNMLSHSGHTLHILGICSNAGTHGDTKIIIATIQAALEHKIKKIVIHAFLDGRDVPIKSAATFLEQIQKLVDQHPQVQIGSISGRWYAMDRAGNWDRTGATFCMLTQEQKNQFTNWQQALDYYYKKGITDEFIPSTLLNWQDIIKNGDGLVFTNFREERERQLAQCFLQPDKVPLKIKAPAIAFLLSTTRYDASFTNPILINRPLIGHTLKEIISKAGKRIFSIAETEKHAHVTFFFGGGHEKPFAGETQVIIPSKKAITYAECPQMSAQEITHAVIQSLQTDPADFYLINYANADMVGHTGNFSATVEAIECLDSQLKQLYEYLVEKMDGTLIITADHGNAEDVLAKMSVPHTEHTTNKVPLILIKNELRQKKTVLAAHELADVASLVLKELSID